MSRYNLILFSVTLLLASCIQSSNLRLYYYPFYDLERGRVYVYRSSTIFNEHFYVALKSRTEAGKNYLYIEQFDNDLNMLTRSKELIGNEGSEVIEFSAMLEGTDTYVKIDKSNSVFFWDFVEPALFIASNENGKYEIRRLFQRTFVNYLFQGINYPSAYVIQEGNGELYDDIMKNYNMTDLYFAKGIGLIAFKIQRNKTEEFMLDRTLSMNEWRILRGAN